MTAPYSGQYHSDMNPVIAGCPVAIAAYARGDDLASIINDLWVPLGDINAACKCSPHRVPFVTDLAYDQFIKGQPTKQLVIIAVISSRSDTA